MTYADDDFQPEPDTLHEIVSEDGTVLYESFDAEEIQEIKDELDEHWLGGTLTIKSTPV